MLTMSLPKNIIVGTIRRPRSLRESPLLIAMLPIHQIDSDIYF